MTPAAVGAAESLNLVEIFASVQGEGPDVGRSTVFVRLGECDLRCRWCDTPHSWKPAKRCRIETERGSAAFREVPNPVAIDAIAAAVDDLEFAQHRFVSLTGGEPLLQPAGLRALLQRLHGRGPRVHLETHGLHAEALEEVIEWVDVVSMDWKLASDVRRADAPRDAPEEDFHALHARFLAAARRGAEVVVKVVVTPSTRPDEIDAVCRGVASVDRAVPVVVQPVTPFGACRESVPAAELLALVATLERSLADVRLIPQTHPILGAL